MISNDMASDFIKANEELGNGLTEIGMTLGLPKPRPGATWGVPEVLLLAGQLMEMLDEQRNRTAAMLAEFHGVLGQRFGDGGRSRELRAELHREENRELCDELDAGNRVGIAQELADVVYVAYGTAYSEGIDLDAVLREVHRANMSKVGPDGRFVFREDGKVLKGPNYQAPDIAAVLHATGTTS